MRNTLPILALFSLLLTQAFTAQAAEDTSEKYLLQYKFKRGETLRYRVKHALDLRTTIEETTQEVESASESVKAWKVTDVLPNGEMEFIHVVESVKMSNTVPNRGTVKYNSETDKEPPTNFEQVARTIGVPLTKTRIKPDGQVVSREEKHPQPPATEDMPITLRMPAEAITIGEKWDWTYDVDAQRKNETPLKVRTRRLCKLESVESGIATISVRYQILTPVSAYVESQLKDRLTKGTIRFDIDAGRTVSQRLDADKRIIGFSGKASSLHFTSRMEERLIKSNKRVARK